MQRKSTYLKIDLPIAHHLLINFKLFKRLSYRLKYLGTVPQLLRYVPVPTYLPTYGTVPGTNARYRDRRKVAGYGNKILSLLNLNAKHLRNQFCSESEDPEETFCLSRNPVWFVKN